MGGDRERDVFFRRRAREARRETPSRERPNDTGTAGKVIDLMEALKKALDPTPPGKEG